MKFILNKLPQIFANMQNVICNCKVQCLASLCCVSKSNEFITPENEIKTQRHICSIGCCCCSLHTHQYQRFAPSISSSCSLVVVTNKQKFRFQMIFCVIIIIISLSLTFAFLQCSFCMSCDTYFSFFLAFFRFLMNVMHLQWQQFVRQPVSYCSLFVYSMHAFAFKYN